MKLHEYQAKHLFATYGLPVPEGVVVHEKDDIKKVLQTMPTGPWVVKAQVHAGGRGKAGGVRIVESEDALKEAILQLLHTQLVTYQTDAHGQPVNSLLIEKKETLSRELYLGMLIDRSSQRLVCMASTAGGMDIETVAKETPEKILRLTVDPLLKMRAYQARELGYGLGLNEVAIKQFIPIMQNLEKLFIERDLSLLEINPLGITANGSLLCVDGKMVIDDNALFRQVELRALEDISQNNAQETVAKEWDLNYIALDGDIGCMVNGAGLAMATMDLILLKGGQPANFLDVGGTANQERVSAAFQILLSAPKVKSILVNIFGGIVRCDLIAAGIIESVKKKNVTLPVIVRLEGNSAELARNMLKESGLNIIPAHSLLEAAQYAVQAIRKAS